MKPFFYRLVAADFSEKVSDLSDVSDKKLAQWVKKFARDLVHGKSEDEFTINMIDEAKKFKESKVLAGKKGMGSRWQKP